MKYLVKIKYLGTKFSGFQYQINGRTVQNELNIASEKIFGTRCMVTGCGRTDRGVHANEYCVTIEPVGESSSISLESIPSAFNAVFPCDISAFSAEVVSDDFHPRYSAHRKEYIYKIYNSSFTDPFLLGRVWRIARPFSENGYEKMLSATKYIVGKHDFFSFMSKGSKVADTVREVYYCNLLREGDMMTLGICADGFLYNMVRIIVGTITEVGFGKIQPEDIPEIINSKNRTNAGPTAPAEGLYLNHVSY